MRRLLLVAIVGLTVAGLCTTALAASTITPISAGGSYTGGNSGGEFQITQISEPLASQYVAGAAQLVADTFQTFCVERDETFNPNQVYDVVLNDEAIAGGSGGPSPDPLSEGAAWLFYAFTKDLFTGSLQYTYAPGAARTADATDLQLAIWALEDEYPAASLTGKAEDYYDAGVAADTADVFGDTIGPVRVMNLTQNGALKQDMLVVIPTPSAMLLGFGLIGCIGLVRVVRRR